MKRLTVFLAALLLMASATALAVDQPSTPLTFGAFDGVKTVWAEYTSEAESLTVTFPASVGEGYQALSNYKEGVLRVAVVSTVPLDLTRPIAYVTEPGSEQAPTLKLTALRFNEVPVAVSFTPSSLEVRKSGSTLDVQGTVLTPTTGNRTVIVAAYSADGKMLTVQFAAIALEHTRETFQISLQDCANAARVKAFFPTGNYVPDSLCLEWIEGS